MSKYAAPWVRSRGMGRLLAQETIVSDLIQFLSDRDPSPWAELVGFVPDNVAREAQNANHADLLLTADSQAAVVEVKLGHLMSTKQQAKYEALHPRPDLYLAALSSDGARLEADSDRWSFLGLSELIGRWERVDDELARLFAGEAAGVLRTWDQMIWGVFGLPTAEESRPLSVLNQKLLARVVTRRIAHDLQKQDDWRQQASRAEVACPSSRAGPRCGARGTTARSSRRSDGGRRSWEANCGSASTSTPRPDQDEDEDVRRAPYELARSMNADIEFASLKSHLSKERTNLAALIRRDNPSRPEPKGDWESVIAHGFKGAPLADGRKNNRRLTSPNFFGDGALRFQAIADIDFDRASARDLTNLIDCTLEYLNSRQP